MSETRNPYANVGDTRKPVSNFWKPTEPATLVGKLDRIDDGKRYGDRAIFKGIVYDATWKPIRAGEILLGISVNLAGRITPEDSGSWFLVAFTGFAKATAGNNPARLFDVKIVTEPEQVATLKATLAKDAEYLAHHPIDTDQEGADDGEDDSLPF